MMHFWGGNSPERRVARLLAKGERLFRRGKQREGLEKFAEAANVLPEASEPSLHLGRAYCQLGEYDLGLKQYYKALYFADIAEEPGILYEIAQVYFTMQRYDLAEEKLKKVLHSDFGLLPSQLYEVKNMALHGLAHIYLRTGRISEAIDQQKRLLESVPDNIHVIQMLAESHRCLGENHEARVCLRQAIELAQYAGLRTELEQLEQQLHTVEFPDGTEWGIKEQFSADYGSMCLGTADDNGIRIAVHHDGNALSLTELAVTLKRLAAFGRAFFWKITCIVSVDKQSASVSSAIASLLRMPVKAVANVTRQDRVLLCQNVWISPKLAKHTLQKLAKRTDAVISFALFALVPEKHHASMPDIIGIPVKKTVKTSVDIPETDSCETFIQRVTDRFSALPEEENLPQQIAYYEMQNRRIRPHLVPAVKPQEAHTPRDQELTDRIDRFHKPDTDLLHKISIVDALGVSSSRKVSGVIYAALQDDHKDLRMCAVRYLPKLDLAVGVSDLFTRLLNDNPDILSPAIRFLTTCKTTPCYAVLHQALPDLLRRKEPVVVHEALRAVKSCGEKDLIPIVIELLAHPDPYLVEQAILTIGGIGDVKARHHLLRIVQVAEQHFENRDIVSAAVKTLARLRDSRGLSFVKQAVSKFPDEEIIAQYIALVGAVGEEHDRQALIPYLGHAPVIQFRAAAVLYTHGMKPYFQILRDGIRSKKLSINLLALDALGEIGDELSMPVMCSVLSRQHLQLDQKIAEVICRCSKFIDYSVLFHTLQPADAEMVKHAIQRAILGSQTLSEVLNGLESLYALLLADAIPMFRQFCATTSHSVILCGAMTCLALYDPTGSQDVIKQYLDDQDVKVANTAYVLTSQLKG
jgi:tetratricopeptide (TPR) repeat protein/HEAT repeat protein